MDKKIREKHPLTIRWAHWINFPVLMIMIWSGMLIYWANDVYSITLFGHTFLHFFPDSFYKFLNVPQRLAEGMAFHFLFMWFFAINGFLYVLYTAISGEWRQLLPNRHSFKEAWFVVLHDLHIRKMAPPQDKYNAAQRIAYTSIIVMGFGSLITGFAIYKPVQLYWLTWLCGGYHLARIWHFVLTIGYVLFFVIHIVQVIIAGWNNFRSVISGFEVVKEKNILSVQGVYGGQAQTVVPGLGQPEAETKTADNQNTGNDSAVPALEQPEAETNRVYNESTADDLSLVSGDEKVKEENTTNLQNPDDEKPVE